MVSVPMAIVDFIPVILFTVSAVMLQKEFYDRMNKAVFAVFSAGTIMITTAGIFKATWKLLLALSNYDFDRLNQSFFPLQSVGFLLAGIAVMAMVIGKKKDTVNSVAPVLFTGTWIFVSVMILGMLGLCTGLSVEAFKRKKIPAMIMYIVTFFLMLCMGYLSSRNFEQASMNWIAEVVNIAGWLIFLVGTRLLTAKGK
ncbi:MAG: hypothetical protein J5825_09570 [Lachnospiraceae bacterium]|nr:hypothetical protein [Lachnospiraceae bacterium]MBR5046735.1 hypothetical protein [Eubacterium sp.]